MRAIEKLFVGSPLRLYLQMKSEAPRVLSGLGFREGSTCLEIGAGKGVGLLLIKKYLDCSRLIGIDIDPAMVRAARKLISSPPAWAKNMRADKIEVLVEDATRLSFKDVSFDAAFNFDVLVHIKEWRRVISEVFRVLKPGGIYSFEDFLLPRSRLLFHGYLGHVPITETELKKALKDTGFSILSFDRARRLPVIFTRALKPEDKR